jgi:hypothetical protein
MRVLILYVSTCQATSGSKQGKLQALPMLRLIGRNLARGAYACGKPPSSPILICILEPYSFILIRQKFVSDTMRFLTSLFKQMLTEAFL